MSTQHPPRPFISALRFAAVPTAVGCARVFARQTLFTWQRPDAAEIAALITSELVTNAVAASGTIDPHHAYAALATVQIIHVRLSLRGTALLIEVRDTSDQPPVLQQRSQDAEHGRGLLIVHSQSQRWGTTYLPKVGGKVVWAEIAVPRADALSATRLRPIAPAPANSASPAPTAAV